MSNLRTAAKQALEALDLCRDWPGAYDECSQAITALRAALKQPEQGPVLTINKRGSLVECSPTIAAFALPDGEFTLYTHPPRREWLGLTEEEIYPLYSEPSSDAEMVEFARAIEAALKEKNHHE